MTINKSLLSLAVVTALGITFSGCGSDDSSSTSSTTTDVTVERGAVYDAVVKDAKGSLAKQQSGKNVYTFTGVPTYPITVTNGWIDVDGDGNKTTKDINLNYTMKSYSTVVTPVTTYIADDNKTIRDQKLNELLSLVGDTNLTAEDLLEVASKAPKEAQVVINAVYMAESEAINNSSNMNLNDISSKINELENIDIPSDASSEQIALNYENYVINESALQSTFDGLKITNDEIVTVVTSNEQNTTNSEVSESNTVIDNENSLESKYNMPELDISTVNSDSKTIIIYNNYPADSAEQLKNTYSSNDGVAYYVTSNTVTCANDFSKFTYCSDIDTNTIIPDYNAENNTNSLSVVVAYDIPDYTPDTSSASINDLKGKTFYTIDLEEAYASYSKFTIPNEFTVASFNSDDATEKDYTLSNGTWVEDADTEDTDTVTSVNIVGDTLVIKGTDTEDGVTTPYTIIMSISEKNTEYWTIKYDYSTIYNGNTINNAMYEKYYLAPTAEMKDPSLINITTYSNLNRDVRSKVNNILSKILK